MHSTIFKDLSGEPSIHPTSIHLKCEIFCRIDGLPLQKLTITLTSSIIHYLELRLISETQLEFVKLN